MFIRHLKAAVIGTSFAAMSLMAPTGSAHAAPAAAATSTCHGKTATTVLGPDASAEVTGTSGDDVIVILADSPTYRVDAGDGDDTVCTFAMHRSELYGQGGDDWLSAAGSSASAYLSGGFGEDFILGSSHDDTIAAQVGDGSVDRYYGKGGNDYFVGDPTHGGDLTYGGTGIDIWDGESAHRGQGMTIDAARGVVHVYSGGNERVRGVETWRGGDGADTMTGGAEPDTFYGRMGNDRLIGGGGKDDVDGGGGVDTCQAEAERFCERNPA